MEKYIVFICGGVDGVVFAVVTTFVGGVNGTIAAFVDASGTNAGFSSPNSVFVDVHGGVYVADSSNNRLRKVTAGGGTRFWVVGGARVFPFFVHCFD